MPILALRRSQPVSRETLADTLWPDLAYDTSLANLNTTVYYLRRSLEPNLPRPAQSSYIRCENSMYWLASDMAYSLDIDEFESCLMAARGETDDLTKFELYSRSVALYRGALLEDLDANHPWLLTERQRYHDLYLSALEALGTLHEYNGAMFEAEQLYAKALAFDPCNESVARRLINLLVITGRRQHAIAYCRRLRSMLQDDLGITPSAETMAVCRRAWCDQPTK